MDADKVKISHPDKLMYPAAGLRKQDIADYYARIADYMLPFIAGRPLTLRCYPDGIGKAGFFAKHAPGHFPDYVERLDVPMRSRGGQPMQMVLADEAADLVYFAGQNAIELHMPLAKEGALDCPDQLVLDFDPSDDDFEKVREAAFVLGEMLGGWGLPSFVKTTGSRGVHVHVPLQAEAPFDKVKPVARHWAARIAKIRPDIATTEQRKNQRGDKVFVDYLRNDYGMTAVAPYSLRAREEAPVATPISWRELGEKSLGPRQYTLKNIFTRLAVNPDPWKDFGTRRASFAEISQTVD